MPPKKLKKCNFEQSRNWQITDYKLLDFQTIYDEYNDVIRFIAWGREVCPSTKRIHNQAWIQLVNKKTRNGVKRLLNCNSLHLEPCRGSEYHNQKYCRKDGKFKSCGKFIKQGARTDLEEIKKKLYEGATMREIADSYTSNFYRYHSGIAKHRQLILEHQSKKFRKLKTEVYYGDTGAGKTRKAMEENPDAFKIQAGALDWWDGYRGQKTVIIDEYDTDVKITKILALLDGYQLRLPIKGAFTYASWNKVIITSNVNPDEWHPNAKPEHLLALKRRIHKVYRFRNNSVIRCQCVKG